MDKDYKSYTDPIAYNAIQKSDIKTSLKNEIEHVENLIASNQEHLRIVKAKLKLIEKNSDLEAYLNLDRS